MSYQYLNSNHVCHQWKAGEDSLLHSDYVTLMWCDDNYGYMTRYSDASEQRRQGGAGVYYHLSYWGRRKEPRPKTRRK